MTRGTARRSTGGRRRRLDVRVTDGLGRPTPLGRGLAAWLSRAAPRGAAGAVTVAIVSDAAIRRLNREFRGTDAVTDVLSFPGGDAGWPTTNGRRPTGTSGAAAQGRTRGPHPWAVGRGPLTDRDWPLTSLGDIAIAAGLARRQARQRGHSLPTEVRILALHGLLHLLGYDHEADRGQMGRLEDRLRRRAGLPSALIARTSRSPAHR